MADPDPMDLLAVPFETGEIDPPAPGGLLVLRARPGSRFARDALVCEQGLRPLHDALAAEGRTVHPALPEGTAPFPAAAVALTRARDETFANFARAWALTVPGGPVLAAGAKTDGIETLQKALRREGLEVEARPMKHGRVLTTRRLDATPDVFAKWAEAAVPAPAADGADGRKWFTAAGVFSRDGVDPGSAMLAEALPELKGAGADLGAGWGFLSAAALAQPGVTSVELIEADHAALACARLNVTDPRAGFRWADARAPGMPMGRLDWVIANPPFHDGREVAVSLGEAFLATAARLLKLSGQAIVVANRTLPYDRALGELFAEVEEIAGDRVYKVLAARRPKPAPKGGRAAAPAASGRAGAGARGRVPQRGR
ncbi:MAG: methyltransferase [Pseudomonadota bacterium]|nr:methyltransferase [Pseudomonadota bacterium]MEE3099816.1 methyltransferase [Pseudomonadota bacterium]